MCATKVAWSDPLGRFVHYAGVVDTDVKPGSRLWMILLGIAGVVVVVLSWKVPEPEQSSTNPAQRVDAGSISLAQCAKENVPAPNYGARTMSYTACVN